MRFIVEQISINDIENESRYIEKCFDDFLEFKIYINNFESEGDIAEYMENNWKLMGCYKDKKYQKFWDYALDKVIKKAKDSYYIYLIGRGTRWPKDAIDYDKLIDALIEKDKTGEYICWAVRDWPEDKIDYKKLINAFVIKSYFNKYVKWALLSWPEKAKQILKQKLEKLKMKFVLEEIELNDIIMNHKNLQSYCFDNFIDFKVFINNLDLRTLCFYMAQTSCYHEKKYQKFWDYALDKIIEKDKYGDYIYDIGIEWPQDKINWEKLTDALIEKDEDGVNIYLAGTKWPQNKIDYNKLVNALITKDKKREYINWALRYWPKKGKDILAQKLGGIK